MMQCRKFQPAPDLAPWLAQGWEWRLGHPQPMPEIFPGTGAEILFNLGAPLTITILSSADAPRSVTVATGAAVLLCPRHARLRFAAHGQTHLLGLRLRSSACFDLFGVPLEQLSDRVLSLDELGIVCPDPQWLMQEGAGALGAWLRQQVARCPPRDLALVRAIERLYYGTPAIELQLQLGMSARTFQRRLRSHLGVDARYFLRTARFQRALRQLLSGAPSLDALLEQGYCDQPHFIKSCHFFTGRSPGQLLTPEHQRLNHYSPQINRPAGSL
ncbi:helix-turn-helix domain-containing protein [Aeromonas dhakensis]|uniref:helix-turn-helix domain-containing protein n=1 Tax=Aeromonas dhakensis TaxID=196024 RepID=UPI003BA3A8B3